MSELTQSLQDLPASGLIPVAALVLIGLLLWAVGRKILRAGFAVVGLIVGGLAGWLIAETMNLNLVAAWIAAATGALALALVATLAFRLAVAASMACVFAIAAPLGVITYAEFRAEQDGHALAEAEVHHPIVDEITQWLKDRDQPLVREQASEALKAAGESAQERLDGASAALNESFEGEAAESIEELRQFSQRMIDALRAKWDSTPQSLRPVLAISSIVGGLFGLVIGAAASTFSAAAITALGGSLLWLCGVQILAVRVGVPDGPWYPSSGSAWLIVWLITSVAGVVIQWTFRTRKADKPG